MKRICRVLAVVLIVCFFTACTVRTEAPDKEQQPVGETQPADETQQSLTQAQQPQNEAPPPTGIQQPVIEPAINPDTDIFHGILAYDITEMLGPEPFTAGEIPETMPVYRNKYVTDGAGVPLEAIGREEMRKIGEEIAAALGVDIVEEEKIYHNENHMKLNCGEISIKIEGNESVYIDFEKVYPLPWKLKKTNEDYLKALGYTNEVLKPLLSYYDINSPEASLWHDYSFDGEKNYPYFANGFINAGKNKTSVLVSFLDNYLSSVRICPDPLSGDILGEYPTISYDEARNLLLNGQWYSSMPLNDPILPDQIKGAAIGYKTQVYDEVFMPFYIFYVDITEREEPAMPERSKKLGLKNYASYIVPAIEEEYLKQFPEIIVHFN
ncbi:MAG TPA: hypothetical protein VN381_10730 [Anaerovoracaceae bacterium]|nr:hypothetical protein [Anaerovoracaceae bacterium]